MENETPIKVTVKPLTDWMLVADRARRTAWKGPIDHDPSSTWKKKILLSRHSPIEAKMFLISFEGIPYCSSVHYVRHKFGISHYVSSQRPDRSPTGAERHTLPQDAPVFHDMVLNAQAIISISKKRLCMKASPETRAAWESVRKEMIRIGETEVAWAMRPECAYCGGYCPELKGCGKCPSLFDKFEEESAQ